MTRKQRAAVALLRYGYAFYIPGSWLNAILLLGPEEEWPGWPQHGVVWDTVGARAQRRLQRTGFVRSDY